MLKCQKCRTEKNLTRHSKTGGHLPPFIPLCRKHHNEVHGIEPKWKPNKKYQPGTQKKKMKK